MLAVPYHLDDHHPDLEFPVEPERTTAARPGRGTPWERMAELYETVAREVAAEVQQDRTPLVMSGDCTTSLGVVAGIQRAGIRPGIVWFDAHGDLQTPQSTTSGYLGGMPLRMLLGEGNPTVAKTIDLQPVPESEVVLVDARDLDPPEVDYLAGSAIRTCGIADVAGDLLPSGALYLHLDLDVVDPTSLPGLLFPSPGGPALREVADAVRAVLSTGRVAALGLACTWQPGRAPVESVRPMVEQFLAAL